MSQILIRLTKRAGISLLLVAVGLLAAAPLAQASDASLKRAVKVYEGRLTKDIGYLANLKLPSRSAAPTVLRRLSKIRNDITGATRAAKGQHGSSSSGRKARTKLLSALSDASAATGSARACAKAARAGNRAAAKSDLKVELRDVNKAIPLFESAGRLLNLF